MNMDYLKAYLLILLSITFSFYPHAQEGKKLNEKVPEKSTLESKNTTSPTDTSISIDRLNEYWRMQDAQKNEIPSALSERESLQKSGELANKNEAAYLLNNYILKKRNSKYIKDLQQAYLLEPTNRKIGEEMAGYAYRVNDYVTSKIILEHLKANNHFVSDQLLYAKDLMAVVPENGWLICHGFDDSYAVMYQQVVNNHRRDLKLINMDWLTIDEFRDALRKQGLIIPKSELVNPDFFEEFLNSNFTTPFYVSLSIPKNYIADLKDLPFVGSTVVTNGMRQSYDDIYRKIDFFKRDKVDAKVVNWAKNYLPFLLVYRNELNTKGQKSKAKEVEQVMLKIGIWTNTTEKIKQLLE